jgi:hypothetical protein
VRERGGGATTPRCATTAPVPRAKPRPPMIGSHHPRRPRLLALAESALGPLLLDWEEHDRPPAVLVIDDLHLVDDDDVVATSLALLARHPAWLHHTPRRSP